jgi:tRNA (guanine-N7-)-methyltransferase
VASPSYTALLKERRQSLRDELDRCLPEGGSFVWEIGCGHGHFLTAYAEAHPEQRCIGIDIASDRVERAVRKRERAKLTNLHFIQAEARLFVEAMPPMARIARLFILFPDPWPKLRHNKHRIIQPEFLTAVAAKTVEHCPLYFRTDFEPYFLAALETIRGHLDWELSAESWPFEYETVFQQRADGYHSLVARRRSVKMPSSAP